MDLGYKKSVNAMLISKRHPEVLRLRRKITFDPDDQVGLLVDRATHLFAGAKVD
jgi:hypothetical protein